MMILRNAKELEAEIHATEKQKMFNELMETQQNIIKDAMEKGNTMALWIFANRDSLLSPLRLKFADEFEKKATSMFEDAGYTVRFRGSWVKW